MENPQLTRFLNAQASITGREPLSSADAEAFFPDVQDDLQTVMHLFDINEINFTREQAFLLSELLRSLTVPLPANHDPRQDMRTIENGATEATLYKMTPDLLHFIAEIFRAVENQEYVSR
ncbi:MAG: hypothetical protein WDZ94_04690 [Patescibacteria group bacterium]